MLTLYAISGYIVLLILNFTLAAITYHIEAIRPVWLLSRTVNKLSVIAIPVCMMLDLFS